MNVKEAIQKINNGEYYSLNDAEDVIFEGNHAIEVASDLNIDEHRWFIISTSVYKLEDGFVGVTGVSSLKSEGMMYSDCDVKPYAEEYEEFTTVSYRPKK